MPAIAKEKQVFLTIHFPKYDFTQSGGYGQRVIKYAVRIDIAGKFRFGKPCAHIGCKAGAQQQQVVLYISAYARTPCLTPGCQTYQDPNVRHAKTRMSDMPRPGCRTYPVRQSGKLASQRESISVKRGENVRTNSRKRQAAKQKTDKMIQPSVFFCYFCIL